MASLSTPRSPGFEAALIAGGAGVAAAALTLVLLRSPVIAAGFLGAALVLAGAMLAWYRLAPRASGQGEVATDWRTAATIAAACEDALAVTDRAGRLV